MEDPAKPEETVDPDAFPPYDDWLAKWKPYDGYISLREAAQRIEAAGKDLHLVLGRCHCIGQTFQVEKEIPSSMWANAEWRWDAESNMSWNQRYASVDYLKFQTQVFEHDLDVALGAAPEEPLSQMREDLAPAPPEAPLAVETVEAPALPEGWVLYTVDGVAWQAALDVAEETSTYGPMRLSAAHAVGDAWSMSSRGSWTPRD